MNITAVRHGHGHDESMAAMQEAVAGMAAVPEFTAPRGNGAAFEKFLDSYRDMLATGHEASGATGTALTDHVELQA